MTFSIKHIKVCCLLFILFSCTKEGLPGPEGEQGPPGEDATGGGPGGATRIISYYTPAGTTFAWEVVTTGTSRLKFTTATHSGYTFTLPDSVTKYIDEGALLIYADRGNGTMHLWQQLQAVHAGFYDIADQAYTIERIAGTGYRLTFLTIGKPSLKYQQLRFVVIPNTSSDAFGN
jgi:hypothetical protein